ncbi:Phage-related minor tail protein [compost metagenome]
MSEEIEVSNLVTKLTIDDTGVEQSMAQLARQMKVVQSEFTAASSRLGDHTKSQEGLRTKADSLSKQLEIQGQRVAKLKRQHEESVASKGKDAKATQDLEVKLNRAVAQYNRLHNELQQTTAEINKQNNAWKNISSALDAAEKKMAAIGRKMSAAGQSLAMMVTAPLVAVGAASTKASIDFESAFAGVRKTVDATEEEFQKISDSLREMSTVGPSTASELAVIAEAAGQLGIQNDAILSFTSTMSDLGVATNMSANQAATALARLANITQMPQENFDRLGATIVALGNNLATTESEITEMALRLAGAGHQIGLSEAQILALAGSLSSVGIEAEAGGSSFSRVMINMAQAVATGGKDLNNFAAVAGMSVSQFKDAFQKDASGALISFVEGLGRMSKSGENTFAVLELLGLSEIRVRDALLRASGAGDLFRNSMELGTKAWEENSALTNEASRRYETTASQLKILGNRIVDAAITLGDALVPAIMSVLDALGPMFENIEKGAEWFASLDTASQKTILTFVAMAAAAGPLLIISGQLVTNVSALIPVIKGLGAALTWLTTNPIGMAVAAIGLLVTAIFSIKNSMDANKQAALELKQAQLELQEVQQNGIERHEIQMYEEKKAKLEELIATYQALIDKALEVKESQKEDKMLDDSSNSIIAVSTAAKELNVNLTELQDIANDYGITLEFVDENSLIAAKSMNGLTDAKNTLTKAVKDAKRETTSELNEMAKQIALRKQEVTSVENLLKIYSSAKKGSTEWKNAQKELINQFPQFATATGVNTEAVKGLILVKQQEINLEWQGIQVKAQEALQEKQAAITKQQAAIGVAQAIEKITGASGPAQARVKRLNEELEVLRGEAASLQALLNMNPDDFKLPPVTVPTAPATLDSGGDKKSSTAKSYSNEALDEAYKQLEHKKRLDQLTLESELNTLLEIKKAHIKTADERMAIEEKIYDVKKQIAERDKELRQSNFEYAKQQLQAEYEDRIAREGMSAEDRLKLEEGLTREQILLHKEYLQQLEDDMRDRFRVEDKLLNDQIWQNKNYLQKVMSDNRFTSAEKRKIEREITEDIRKATNDRLILQRQYTEETMKLAREAAEEQKKTQISSINDMSKALQDALKNKYQEEKKATEDRIKSDLEANEDWKKEQLDSIKTVYNARVEAAQKAADAEIERINAVYNAQIEAIQKELDALNRAEKQRSRDELDAEDQKKIGRLQAKIEYEHDDFNRKQLQGQLNKVIADMNERHRQEDLEDKKESLKEEQQSIKDKLVEETQAIKDQLTAKKEIMAQEYEAQQANINAIYAAQKASLDQQLLDAQAHYAALLSAKSIQTEAEKMIIQGQQEDILKLLGEFGDGYQAAGQTLGEKLIAGFKPKIDEIKSMIADVISQIDAARSAALSAMAVAPSSAGGGGSSSSDGGSGSGSTPVIRGTVTGVTKPGSSTSTPVIHGTVVSVTNNFNNKVTSPSDVSRATTKSAQQLASKL